MNLLEKIQALAPKILNRSLNKAEEDEYLRLGAVMGERNVEDYLAMLLAFKRSEDKITEQMALFTREMESRFAQMGDLKGQMLAAISKTVNDRFEQNSQKIEKDMGNNIASRAIDVLREGQDYYYIKGQVIVACTITFLAVAAYWLGQLNAFHFEGMNFLRLILRFPAGGVILICVGVYLLISYVESEWRYRDWVISAYWMYVIKSIIVIIFMLVMLLAML